MPEWLIRFLDMVLLGIMIYGYHCAYMDMRPRNDMNDVKPRLGRIPEL